jgi:RHS repeat-associated protein
VDDTAAVVGTADWDVFGNERASTGVDGLFGWTGQQQDADTGLTYLRARYYAPGSGRFLTRDAMQPNGPGTQGYNRYAYAGNNPITLIDPTGHCVCAVQTLDTLGQKLANTFWIIAAIFDCILWGACRYHRDPWIGGSGPGGAGPGGGPGSGPNGGGPDGPGGPGSGPTGPCRPASVCELPNTGDGPPPPPVYGPFPSNCQGTSLPIPNCDLEAWAIVYYLAFDASLEDFLSYEKAQYFSPRIQWPRNPSCDVIQGLINTQIPGTNFDFPLSFNFTASCHRHDFGYRVVKRNVGGISSSAWQDDYRHRVDSQLYRDMIFQCATGWGASLPVIEIPLVACQNEALAVYTAVDLGGSTH